MKTINMNQLAELYLRQCVQNGYEIADGVLCQVVLDILQGQNVKDRMLTKRACDIVKSVKSRAK